MSQPVDPIAAAEAEDEQHEENLSADKFREKQRSDDIKWLMAHPQGRRIVTRIFEKTGIRRTPFNTNGSTMAFNAGMQNVGLWIEGEVLTNAPERYLQLLKEFAND